jgi:hypothetical protein
MVDSLEDKPYSLRLAEKRASYFVRPKLTADMGKIVTTVTVTNNTDNDLAKRGELPMGRVRSVVLEGVVADTGATLMCLPADVIEGLGLQLEREVLVSTATGVNKARIFSGLRIAVMDRTVTQDCLELPGGTDPLLGALPMEALGVQLNLQDQTLRLLPIDGVDTFLTIY